MNGQEADSNNPDTWTSFEQVKSTLLNNNGTYQGIGFVFSENDEYVGIDYDNVVDENGNWNNDVLQEVKKSGSFAELSPSGKGCHVIVRGSKKPEGKHRSSKDGIREIYDCKRFFTVTGDLLNPHNQVIEASGYIDQVQGKIGYRGNKDTQKGGYFTSQLQRLKDDTIIEKCRNAANKEKFENLFNGDWEREGYQSQSEGDQALCNILAFYTKDENQINRIFRKSGLNRDKWESREDYREDTIQNALNHVTEEYGNNTIETETENGNKNKYNGKNLDKPENPAFNEVAEYVIENNNLFVTKDTGEYYVYNDGVYVNDGKNPVLLRNKIRAAYKELFKIKNLDKIKEGTIEVTPEAKRDMINEVLQYIYDTKFVKRSEIDNYKDEVVVNNGVLNIFTGELKDFTPKKLITTKIPVNYDPKANCPQFDKFLEDIFEPEDRRTIQDQKDLIYEWMGYSLYKSYPFQKGLLLVGEGANGKGTLLNIWNDFLGEENVAAIGLDEIADLEKHKFRLKGLFGKMANLCGDLGNKEISNTEGFKRATGGDLIDIEVKYVADPMRFYNHAKCVFGINRVPITADDSVGFWRRWIIMRLPNRFMGNNEDISIVDKCTTEEEKSGILNKAITGVQRLFNNNGFTKQDTVEEAKEKWIKYSNPTADFFENKIDIGEDYSIKKDWLYVQFVNHCEENGIPKMAKNHFFRSFKKLLKNENIQFKEKRLKPDENGKRELVIEGVKVIEKETTQEVIYENKGNNNKKNELTTNSKIRQELKDIHKNKWCVRDGNSPVNNANKGEFRTMSKVELIKRDFDISEYDLSVIINKMIEQNEFN